LPARSPSLALAAMLLAAPRMMSSRLAFPSVIAFMLALVLAGCGGSSSAKPHGLTALHTDGRFIKDSAGNTVILRGVAVADLMCFWRDPDCNHPVAICDLAGGIPHVCP
jgi:hypothetical protein